MHPEGPSPFSVWLQQESIWFKWNALHDIKQVPHFAVHKISETIKNFITHFKGS
jgi:hypothetical protein